MRVIDDSRKQAFLSELERTGRVHHSSRVASPHLIGNKAGLSGFRYQRRVDPEFRAAWEEAMAAYERRQRLSATTAARQVFVEREQECRS